MLEALPSAVSEEAYPFDPDFPQLTFASDPALMLEVFRAQLKPVAGKAFHIAECIPFRFRCRQSTERCVLQYTLRLVESNTGRPLDQWVTCLIYAQPGAARRLGEEMRADGLGREVPDGWRTFEPVGFIPELQMHAQLFPCDRKLPNLCRVMGGALRGFEPQVLAPLGPGQWGVQTRHLEPTRYRTELGAALRYTVQVRDARRGRLATRRCYLKVYRNEQGGETYQLLRALSGRRGNGQRPFSVATPIAYLGELRTLALEEAPGTPMQQILLQGRDSEAAGRAVARAAAAFNRNQLRLARRHTLQEQCHDVKRAARLVEWACPQVRAETRAISAAVLAGLQEVVPAPIHRDLKPDHIFLDGERVIFIDLDSVALGDPVRDPAHLFAHLTARVGLDEMPREQARGAAAAFVEEYFAHVPGSWRARFPVHCAGALLEVAASIFKRQEPHWPEKVTICIEEAHHALSR